MSLFKAVRTSQPQSGSTIDWSNPLTKGLILCVNPAVGLKNLVPGYADVVTTGLTKKVNRSGNVASGFNLATAYLKWNPPAGLTAATASVLLRVPSVSSSVPFSTISSQVSFTPYSNGLYYCCEFSSAGTRYVSELSAAGDYTKPRMVTARGSSVASSHALFVDGIKLGTGNLAFGYDTTVSFGGKTAGITHSSTTDEHSLILFWNRC